MAGPKQGLVEGHYFLQHTQQEGAGSAGRVNGLHPGDSVGDFQGLSDGDGLRVGVVHQVRDAGCIQPSDVPTAQVSLDGLAAHEGYHWTWSVVGAVAVALVNRILEQLAQHLRVYRHLGVQRRRLHHREVVAVEQPSYQGRYRFVGNVQARVPVQFRPLEQPAVEEGHVAN